MYIIINIFLYCCVLLIKIKKEEINCKKNFYYLYVISCCG